MTTTLVKGGLTIRLQYKIHHISNLKILLSPLLVCILLLLILHLGYINLENLNNVLILQITYTRHSIVIHGHKWWHLNTHRDKSTLPMLSVSLLYNFWDIPSPIYSLFTSDHLSKDGNYYSEWALSHTIWIDPTRNDS